MAFALDALAAYRDTRIFALAQLVTLLAISCYQAAAFAAGAGTGTHLAFGCGLAVALGGLAFCDFFDTHTVFTLSVSIRRVFT